MQTEGILSELVNSVLYYLTIAWDYLGSETRKEP